LTAFEYSKKDVKKIRKAMKNISPDARSLILQSLKTSDSPVLRKELENMSKKK